MGSPGGLLALRALLAGHRRTFAWIADELRVLAPIYLYLALSTTAVFALLGWMLGRKEDLLAARATTDALTGLANRSHFEARTDAEVARAARYGTPLSVLLVDVDHLKSINDRGGHGAGDRALRAVAAALAASCRVTDLAARYGGDEFAVLAPSTSVAQAAVLAERVREQLRSSGPPDLLVSVSVGVADLCPARSGGRDALLRAADAALYVAKSAGRDRVSLAPPQREKDSSLSTRDA
jgi:diguanylate cyclase (GGDEF)-like protein